MVKPILQQLDELANNLIRKDLISDRFKKIIKNPGYMAAAAHNWHKDKFEYYRCTNCQRDIFGPRLYAIEHHKKCMNVEEKAKENELLKTNYHPY